MPEIKRTLQIPDLPWLDGIINFKHPTVDQKKKMFYPEDTVKYCVSNFSGWKDTDTGLPIECKKINIYSSGEELEEITCRILCSDNDLVLAIHDHIKKYSEFSYLDKKKS